MWSEKRFQRVSQGISSKVLFVQWKYVQNYGSKIHFEENMPKYVLSAVPADGLATLAGRPSLHADIIKSK